MDHISELIMAAIVFVALYGALQLLVRRKERLLLIEKGMNSPELKSDLPTFSALKFGLFLIGLGIGVLVGNILVTTTNLEAEVAYFSMIFLFGGIALVLHHFVDKKQNQNKV